MTDDQEFCQAAAEYARRRGWPRVGWQTEREEVVAIIVALLLEKWRKQPKSNAAADRSAKAIQLIHSRSSQILRNVKRFSTALVQGGK